MALFSGDLWWQIGEEFDLSNGFIVKAFKTYHVVPSQVQYTLPDFVVGSHQETIPFSFLWIELCVIHYHGLCIRLPIWQFHVAWQGYVIYSVKQKLKAEYVGIPGKEIKTLKASGVQVQESWDPFHSPALNLFQIAQVSWSVFYFLDRSCFHGWGCDWAFDWIEPFQALVTNYLTLSWWTGYRNRSNSWGCIYGRYYNEFLSGRS